jgi:dTDP-4-amino-4,6-dideoxygalactose transaminase
MISYGKQSINNDDIDFVVNVLKSDFLTMGPLVDTFENKLEGLTRAKTFVVSSGTAALHSAFYGIGIQQGDEVITPANTFVATQATAANLGATIVFADIEPETGLISIESVEKLITSKTKAIVLVDYAGQPCDADLFRNVIGSREIFLMQDAAHSLGSLYKENPIGSVADVTTFSFFPTKNITTGEGGAVSTNNPKVFERAKTFSRQGVVRDRSKFNHNEFAPWSYEVQEFGLNYRLSEIHCALGLSQLSRIEQFKSRRKEIFECYKKQLACINEVRTIKQLPYSDPMWHLFPILVPEKAKLELFQFLVSRGVGVQVNYIPAISHPVFQKQGYSCKSVPNSLRFYQSEISLPIHLGVSHDLVTMICGLVREFFEKNKGL